MKMVVSAQAQKTPSSPIPAFSAMEGKPSISAMASDSLSDVTKLKGAKIFVTVEDALIDVLVVSFHVGSKIFQGALLDVTKKNAPYGIIPPPKPKPEDEGVTKDNIEGQDEKSDKLHSLKQRHTYYQIPAGTTHFFIGRYARSAKDRSVRMRRLRPRKVLCSHCQEICNDSDPAQKKGASTRNKTSQPSSSNPSISFGAATTNGEINHNNRVLTRSARCESSEKKSDFAAADDKGAVVMKIESKTVNEGEESADSNECGKKLLPNQRTDKMVLRKRKLSFPGSIRGAFPVEKQKRINNIKSEDNPSGCPTTPNAAKCSLAKTSPVIKISFANPQGKESVLKIPPRVQLTSDTEEEVNWLMSDSAASKSASAKAAKKALKKAKKEAQKKASTAVVMLSQENGSASLDGDKDRHHHHKHRVKKKRKHKADEETDKFNSENTDTRNMFNATGNEGWCLRTNFASDLPLVSAELNAKQSNVFDDVKNKCLHQKLSISLKRLNAKAYMRCSPKYSVEEDSMISDISDASSGSMGSADGDDYGDVPDFPKHSSPLRDMDKVKPLMMRISTSNVKKCLLDIGREMAVGDIVWGKIHGFPWWPGKVLALTVSQRDNGATINQQAHVSWFGSSTSSYMPCNQLTPFIDDFKLRYNKKKRGPYKEAIRQAWHEANVPAEDIHELNLVTT